ncbi:TOX high mobility group box family member 4b isoform X2 [Engraulis encrasicolus]|uniref:TOX high mobility group box family member 4b isoform X2 n=1 Tax=Engraulis encrasicolus TaxID=184585 RepID=UPI002FD66630
MDLNFYADLSEDSGQPGDQEFLDSQAFNGFDTVVSKFPGGGDNYLAISSDGHHPFLSSSETFHTPSLGDEEFEIPPISLDPDSALSVSDFGELSDGGPSGGVGVVPGNAVVGGDDPSFASTFVNPPSQGLDHLSLGVMGQQGAGTLLESSLTMDLGHSVGSQFSSSSPVTIDVMNDMNHGLLGHNQLTTIDQSELSAQLGLMVGGGAMLGGGHRSQSPDQQLSANDSPADSLQDDDMDDFHQRVQNRGHGVTRPLKFAVPAMPKTLKAQPQYWRVLVDSPVSLSVSPAVISLSPSLSDSPVAPAAAAAAVGGGPSGVGAGGAKRGPRAGGKKAKKPPKDPNEPQKPVSAYALFFRDTQAAIKGQNPNASFGEVSKIVASMWDSLGEEQKQVYKRKTEMAKKEYLKALAAYRANQISQPAIEVMDSAPSPPMAAEPSPPPSSAVGVTRATRGPHIVTDVTNTNTITNICISNIIGDQQGGRSRTTRSQTGTLKPPLVPQEISPPTTPQPATTTTTATARHPPPMQQMQQKPTPPPPRLQQAPPPLQAKPRANATLTGALATVISASALANAPPPPLQIKIVPALLQTDTPIIVAAGNTVSGGATLTAQQHQTAPSATANSSSSPSPSMAMEVTQAAAIVTACSPSPAEEMEVELNVSPGPDVATASAPRLCVRMGCTNTAIESKDWDFEYCSNECVASHCREEFMAWCAFRRQKSTMVT